MIDHHGHFEMVNVAVDKEIVNSGFGNDRQKWWHIKERNVSLKQLGVGRDVKNFASNISTPDKSESSSKKDDNVY